MRAEKINWNCLSPLIHLPGHRNWKTSSGCQQANLSPIAYLYLEFQNIQKHVHTHTTHTHTHTHTYTSATPKNPIGPYIHTYERNELSPISPISISSYHLVEEEEEEGKNI